MKLLNLKNCFSVNWQTFAVAFSVLPINSLELLAKDIEGYAIERLSNECSEAEEKLAVRLLSATQNDFDYETTERLLSLLAKIDCNDRDIETRKWRVILLEDVLNELTNDPMSGCLELYEFWSELKFPEDSPAMIKETPHFDEEFFKRLIASHEAWLKNEKDAINNHTVSGISASGVKGCGDKSVS